MIGDKIIITNQDKKRAKKLLSRILSLPSKSIIAIGGGSGTHKSELAICLQEELYKKNKLSLMVSLDDYYKIHFNFRNEERKNKGIKSVGKQEIDWSSIKTIIKKFKKGNKLFLQIINKYTNSFMLETIDSRGIDYLIIEGLYTNYLRQFKLCNLCIHLEGTPKQTLKFRKKRAKEDEDDSFRKKVVEKEYQEVLKLRKYVDVIFC